VRDVQQGFALVEYAELMVAEDSADRLSEWFPLAEPADKAEVSALKAAAAQLPEGSDAHTRAGFALRPAPPAEVGIALNSALELLCQATCTKDHRAALATQNALVLLPLGLYLHMQGCQRGVARSVGEAVDAWSDGGWWRGHVAALGAGGVAASRSRRGAAQAPLRVARDGSGTEHAPQVGAPWPGCGPMHVLTGCQYMPRVTAPAVRPPLWLDRVSTYHGRSLAVRWMQWYVQHSHPASVRHLQPNIRAATSEVSFG